MKYLVNVIQLAIVAAIILPVLYLFDSDKVDKFCQKIEPGMTQLRFFEIAEEEQVKLSNLTGNEVLDGEWQATVTTRLPLTDYTCLTKGVGNIVATAEIVDTDVEEASQPRN